MNVDQHFSPSTAAWFHESFSAPTKVQEMGWPVIASGAHTLLVAPTGSGKTLAAFLSAIDRVSHGEFGADTGIKVLYISPLKALVHDIQRNLRAPLIGVERCATRLGADFRGVGVDIRTGDTSSRDRRRQLSAPGDVLITTPESLYLLLTSQARENLRTVRVVILDEIHVLASTKRGAHLALSLERLSLLCEQDPQRIGLSATQRPLERVARYLGGDRSVHLVDASEAPRIRLRISVPVPDMERPPAAPAMLESTLAEQPPGESSEEQTGIPGGKSRAPGASSRRNPQHEGGIWPQIYPKILDLIAAHRSTLVFTNSRLLCERLAQKLNECAGEEWVKTHHGSLSHERRHEVEEELKAGRLRALVATSSLELGIDMGAIDLVILIESPGSVASGLQRVGRAGHQVGAYSEGIIFPKYRGDLLEAAVVSSHMQRGKVEETRIPQNCLDVLSQQIVAACAVEEQTRDEIYTWVRRAANYANLAEDVFGGVLEMLSGRFPSDAFADLSPRVVWDRDTGMVRPRRGARQIAVLNGGTIPDRGLFTVHLGEGGPRLGELDEEMVHETRVGDTLILGSSTWRVDGITRDKVLVSPAPGEPGRLPFWRGERPGRPVELGRELGGFLRSLEKLSPTESLSHLQKNTPLDEYAATNLVQYVAEQREATQALPTDECIVMERFRDELGDWRICILTPFGARVHAPWALALEAQLSDEAGFELQVLYSDDGIALRLADTDALPETGDFFPEAEFIEELLLRQLGNSALFAGRFRENATRSLLLPRKRFSGRSPLWLQRRKSSELLALASQHPDFPIVLETYRECLQDVFDLPALQDILRRVQSREIRVVDVETPSASPFAKSLAYAYVATYLYDGDAPLGERKAQALALDRGLLRELLGQEELRELLDADALIEVENELQRRASGYRATHEDGVHDLLRRLGDLSREELKARFEGDLQEALDILLRERRIIEVRVAGQARCICIEDAARYRDALGIVLPNGLPAEWLTTTDAPLASLLQRYAKNHGPFLSRDIAVRWSVSEEVVLSFLEQGLQAGRLVHGEIRPGGSEREWCDADVLRRLKRRSLSKLRAEVAPVDEATFARFLPVWHGIGNVESRAPTRRMDERLLDAVVQLEGASLPFSVWVDEVLPARVPGFRVNDLDLLGATGQIVWIGKGALGPKDGRIALYRRSQVPYLVEVPSDEDRPKEGPHLVLLDHFEARGACFLNELGRVVALPVAELLEVIWDLAFAGWITNDTFQPLAGLRARTNRRKPREMSMVGGRWSSVRDLIGEQPVPTEKSHVQVQSLLQRYGVLSRDAVLAAEHPGGFAAAYPVLREMEDAGRARRGLFLEGRSSAQFALPGVVDRLRSFREQPPHVQVLSAMDPANPWGTLFPWPAREDGARPRRVAGARVLLWGGEPVLFVDKGGKSVITFPGFFEEGAPVPKWLATLAAAQRKSTLAWQKVNGKPIWESGISDALLRFGFTRDYRGMCWSA